MATAEGLPESTLKGEKRTPRPQPRRSSTVEANSKDCLGAVALHSSTAAKKAVSGGKPLKSAQTLKAAKASKERQRAIEEAKILEWLGAAELVSGPQVAEPALTSKTDLGANRKKLATEPVTDDVILRHVGNRLVERGIPSFTRVGLDIKHGIITVRCQVASTSERLLLLEILQSTPGVRKVQDGITVGRSESTGFRFRGLLESFPSTEGVFSSMKNALSGIQPGVVAAAAIVFAFALFFIWPKGPARPFAVYPVKGRVVLEGQPISKATVVLHPRDQRFKSKFPSGLLPRATAQDDGGFTFGTFATADGAPEGEFVATVHLIESVRDGNEWVHGPNLLPALYASPEISPLKVTITRGTREISLLDLHK